MREEIIYLLEEINNGNESEQNAAINNLFIVLQNCYRGTFQDHFFEMDSAYDFSKVILNDQEQKEIIKCLLDRIVHKTLPTISISVIVCANPKFLLEPIVEFFVHNENLVFSDAVLAHQTIATIRNVTLNAFGNKKLRKALKSYYKDNEFLEKIHRFSNHTDEHVAERATDLLKDFNRLF